MVLCNGRLWTSEPVMMKPLYRWSLHIEGRFRLYVTDHTGKLVEAFAYRGVAAWRVAPRVAPARSAPLEKLVNFSSRYARIRSKIGALRSILVKSARYARSTWPAARYARASILLPK